MSLRILTGMALLALAVSAAAVDLKGAEKILPTGKDAGAASKASSLAGIPGVPGLSLPGMSADTAGNAAGVLQYCVKRKYLGGDAVASLGNKLLASQGLSAPAKAQKDPGYQSGLKGVLQGSDGKSFSFDSVPDSIKDQACDLVLKNASALV